MQVQPLSENNRMDHRQSYNNGYNSNKNKYSYTTLFQLDSLKNFHIPEDNMNDDGANYTSSSQNGSQENIGYGFLTEHVNGNRPGKSPDLQSEMSHKRKRQNFRGEAGYGLTVSREEDSNEEDDEGFFENHISEEHYRNMLGEHVQKIKKARLKGESMNPSGVANVHMGTSNSKRSSNAKSGKVVQENQIALNEMKVTPGIERNSPDIVPFGNEFYKLGSCNKNLANVDGNPNFKSGLLEIADGTSYKIPSVYDMLAPSLNLPTFTTLRVEESILNRKFDSKSLVAMLASKKNTKRLNATRMVEPVTEFSSLQERLKTLKSSGAGHNFKLQVFESDFSAIQQDALGTKRLIMSETGMLQYCYVKVLEKGDNFEIIERKLPRKHSVKKDPAILEKEDFEKVTKLWSHIAKRDISKQFKIFSNHAKKQLNDAKKIADCCQKEVKGKTSRTLKSWKVAAGRVKKLSKDMLMFWRRYEKEQAEIRKKEEKEAAEALKREEELREAKRQQQRLNFLISQTEIYTHFVQNKPQVADDAEEDNVKTPEVDDPEEKAYREEAKRIAKKAAIEQKRMIAAFDDECGNYQRLSSGSGEGVPEGSSNMDLLNPSSMPLTSSVQQPKLFHGTLKEYQLKGLQWLVNCYEQGLNGILADEMGLGKTIQAVAFLAHLAEEKNIWGPFLVVAPASVLNNWADEFTKFCPELNVVPYWGPLGERSVLRKNFNKKQRVHKRESSCHVVITSYNLIHVDEKHLRNVSWQYMVLDEAQAIKNSGSQRWKLFKSFKCRNRLLLTGTPVQNNMAELWSLLHFIMPTLFDSHEQFNEWFSKGIENHAEHGGTLNEHQLSRLHAILKPFMLRRVKKDVITEMTSKREVIVECMLSSRQQAFYQAIKNKISVAELMTNSRGQADDKKVETLMNIVIQLRKVCNHPELFERNEGRTFMYFGRISNTLLPPPFGGIEEVYYAGSRNPISFEIPKKVYRGSLLDEDFRNKCLYHQFQIFSHSHVHASVFSSQAENEINNPVKSGTFGFSRLIDLSPTEVAFVSKAHLLARMLFSVRNWDRKYPDGIIEDMFNSKDGKYCCDHIDEGKVRAVTRLLMMPTRSESGLLTRRPTGHTNGIYLVPLVKSHYDRYFDNIKWLQSVYSFIPPTRALPIDATCSDRRFAYQNAEILHNPWVKRLLTGFARTSEFNGPARPQEGSYLIQEIDSCVYSTQPLLKLTNRIFGSSPPVQNFDLAKILRDSGKMQTLDALLKRLRAENHRVLLFAQMTKMLNILEDYMNYRKYKYCRLDGQSSIADRRETVKDFQERSDIFVFLLSTRAGGLGINLTAADTVIFYESDWNPTLDLQAMDRAHRLGQTKEVTVYRLICKETIEEKILLRASQKNAVQQLVMTGGHVSGQADGNVMSAEDVLSLLLDDAQELQKLKEQGSLKGKDKHRKRKGAKSVHLNNDGETYNVNGERGTSSKNVPDVASKKRKGNSEKMPSSKRSKKNLKDASFTGDAAEQSTEPGVFSIINSEEENSSRGWSSPS